MTLPSMQTEGHGGIPAGNSSVETAFNCQVRFFSQALQNVLWERKWAQWEGIGIINQQHKNAPFPLLAEDRTALGRSLYPKQTQQMPPGLHQYSANTGKIQLVSFLSPAAHREGAWLCCSAGSCLLAGGGDQAEPNGPRGSLCPENGEKLVSAANEWMQIVPGLPCRYGSGGVGGENPVQQKWLGVLLCWKCTVSAFL